MHRTTLLLLSIVLLIPMELPSVSRASAQGTDLRSATPGGPAVSANARLRTELEWEFGGKTQRGWDLYTPLINSLIHAGNDPDERQFASSLAKWQAAQGLNPSGVLEGETWSRMITVWQSRRISAREQPRRSRLVTMMERDLYDPERPVELRQVERQTYLAYKRMVAAAMRALGRGNAGDGATGLGGAFGSQRGYDQMRGGRFLSIISAHRSRAYQEQLRREASPVGRAGLAVYSTHFTGRALDLYVGGEPTITRDDNRALQTKTAVYRWLAQNAERFGFYPYFYEPWHWEYHPRK